MPHTKIIEIPSILCCTVRQWVTQRRQREFISVFRIQHKQKQSIEIGMQTGRLFARLCAYLHKKIKAKKPRSLTHALTYTHTRTRTWLQSNVWKGVSQIRILVACPCPNSSRNTVSFPFWVWSTHCPHNIPPYISLLATALKCIFNITTNAAPRSAALSKNNDIN